MLEIARIIQHQWQKKEIRVYRTGSIRGLSAMPNFRRVLNVVCFLIQHSEHGESLKSRILNLGLRNNKTSKF